MNALKEIFRLSFRPIYFFFLILIIPLSQCEKNSEVSQKIVILDPPLAIDEYIGSQTEYLDVDNDGNFDFKFEKNFQSEGRVGTVLKSTSIETLSNDFSIAIIEIPDTIYVKYDSITYYPNVYEIKYNYYSGNFNPNYDTILSTLNFKCPKKFNNANQINENELWFSGEVFFKSSESLKYYDKTSLVFGNWKGEDPYYIAYRKKRNGRTYYGWFKLSVQGTSAITIYEYLSS